MTTKDPVCSMTIEEKGAVGTSTYKGHPYHFCSEACKVKFDGDPDSYVHSESDAEKVEETHGKGEIFIAVKLDVGHPVLLGKAVG